MMALLYSNLFFLTKKIPSKINLANFNEGKGSGTVSSYQTGDRELSATRRGCDGLQYIHLD